MRARYSVVIGAFRFRKGEHAIHGRAQAGSIGKADVLFQHGQAADKDSDGVAQEPLFLCWQG